MHKVSFACLDGLLASNGSNQLTSDAVAMTARMLLRGGAKPDVDSNKSQARSSQLVIVSTGSKVEDVVLRLYKPLGLKVTSFLPKHKGGLQNDFRCYSTFETRQLQWEDSKG